MSVDLTRSAAGSPGIEAGVKLLQAPLKRPRLVKGLAKFKWPEKIIYTNIPRNPAGKIEKPKLREMYVKSAKEAMEKEFRKA